ncbi:hypothetical protein NP493_15g03056 [Ridgeia piscesae]|uniref:Uncharacterized protein n=1 Tax=Ridgeia piscesae TaxID=27915 RepID=A0AAD9PEZ1_RIDPI|nr:hypothetical protein NP493_15g03056 [Ridgeia piscesae]
MFKGLERVVRGGNAHLTLNKTVCATATTRENDVSTSQARKAADKGEWEARGRMTNDRMKKWSSYYQKPSLRTRLMYGQSSSTASPLHP